MEFILCYSSDNRSVTCDVGNTEYLISSGVKGSSLRKTSLAIPCLSMTLPSYLNEVNAL